MSTFQTKTIQASKSFEMTHKNRMSNNVKNKNWIGIRKNILHLSAWLSLFSHCLFVSQFLVTSLFWFFPVCWLLEAFCLGRFCLLVGRVSTQIGLVPDAANYQHCHLTDHTTLSTSVEKSNKQWTKIKQMPTTLPTTKKGESERERARVRAWESSSTFPQPQNVSSRESIFRIIHPLQVHSSSTLLESDIQGFSENWHRRRLALFCCLQIVNFGWLTLLDSSHLSFLLHCFQIVAKIWNMNGINHGLTMARLRMVWS